MGTIHSISLVAVSKGFSEMFRLFVCVVVVSCLSSLVGQPIASASTSLTAPVIDPVRDYWLEARRLAQDHLVLLNRIERSLSSSDGNRLRAVRGQIFLQTFAVDRFLKSSYPSPEVLCASNPANARVGSVAGTDAVSLEEAQVYCALYVSARELLPLRAQLDRRVGMVAETTRFVSVRFGSAEPGQQRPTISPFRENQTTLNLIPESSIAAPRIIGRVAKSPVENLPTLIAPAIQPPDDILAIVRSSRNRLLQVRAAFPVAVRFTVPVQGLQSEQIPNGLYPQESQPYAPFLSQPNTGIARLFPEVDRTSNPSENRLAPTAADPLPLAILMPRSDGLSPRLAIQIEGDRFQIVQTDLDYGFMTDLGDVALETLLPPSSKNVSSLSEALQFFYTYRPPSELEAIQVDRRRFITGKVSDLNLSQPLLSQATAAMNRTYLVRSIQFKVPEIITSGRTLLPSERLSLRDLLKTPSSDLLFAFRPVGRRADGSYTVLWKILTQFSDPQIRDLDRYVVKY